MSNRRQLLTHRRGPSRQQDLFAFQNLQIGLQRLDFGIEFLNGVDQHIGDRPIVDGEVLFVAVRFESAPPAM